MAIRVLIADDNVVVRDAIARTLKADRDLEVVGEAASFAEALQLASTLNLTLCCLTCICRMNAAIRQQS